MMSRQRLMTYALLVLAALTTGCKPKVAVDETKQKNHQDTHKLVLTFTPGTLEGEKFATDASQQPVTLTASQSSQWKQDKAVELRAGQTYFLQVTHYSKAGAPINREYATNNEDKIHQHFFIPSTPDGKLGATELMDYLYLDTEPWDAPISTDARVIGGSNPIGLKGAVTFKAPTDQLTIRLRLLHARGSKFNSKGDASPFYKPGNWTANGQYDVDFTFDLQIK